MFINNTVYIQSKGPGWEGSGYRERLGGCLAVHMVLHCERRENNSFWIAETKTAGCSLTVLTWRAWLWLLLLHIKNTPPVSLWSVFASSLSWRPSPSSLLSERQSASAACCCGRMEKKLLSSLIVLTLSLPPLEHLLHHCPATINSSVQISSNLNKQAHWLLLLLHTNTWMQRSRNYRPHEEQKARSPSCCPTRWRTLWRNPLSDVTASCLT